jgi:hypothetical protein
MSFPSSLKLSFRLLLITLSIILTGCATRSITSFSSYRPQFDPLQYFAGHTHSWGIFESRSGQPQSLIWTTTDGRLAADGLHFEQDIYREGKPKTHRSWLIRLVDAHHYIATGTGVIGKVRGTAYGNVFHLDFTLDAIPGNPLAHVHMSQWMYLQADGRTVINRDTVTKAGLLLTQVTEYFHKDR